MSGLPSGIQGSEQFRIAVETVSAFGEIRDSDMQGRDIAGMALARYSRPTTSGPEASSVGSTTYYDFIKVLDPQSGVGTKVAFAVSETDGAGNGNDYSDFRTFR